MAISIGPPPSCCQDFGLGQRGHYTTRFAIVPLFFLLAASMPSPPCGIVPGPQGVVLPPGSRIRAAAN